MAVIKMEGDRWMWDGMWGFKAKEWPDSKNSFLSWDGRLGLELDLENDFKIRNKWVKEWSQLMRIKNTDRKTVSKKNIR